MAGRAVEPVDSAVPSPRAVAGLAGFRASTRTAHQERTMDIADAKPVATQTRLLESTVKPVNINVESSFACDKTEHFAVVDDGTNVFKPEVKVQCRTGHCKGKLVARELTLDETNKARKFVFADMSAAS
jgi:hypothetical protein